MARRRANPRQHHYLFTHEPYGIVMVAEIEMCFEGQGVPHSHSGYQVLFILEGEMAMSASGRTFPLVPGVVWCVRPEEVHEPVQTPGGPRTVYVDLRISPKPQLPMIQLLRLIEDSPYRHVDPQRLHAAAGRLRRAVLDQPPPHPPTVMAAIWNLLAEATRGDDSPEYRSDARPAADVRVRVVEAHMRESIARPLSIKQLAQSVDLSSVQLRRLFRQHVGVGPAQRFRQIRLEHAIELLVSSTLSVKLIASRCGFANPNHFSRVFREVFGKPPKQFRGSEKAGASPFVNHGR